MLNVKKFDLTYTRCYCEENIYLLCQEIKEKQKELLESSYVVYISNPNKTVKKQKKSFYLYLRGLNQIYIYRYLYGNKKQE